MNDPDERLQRLQSTLEDEGVEHFDADELGRLNAPSWDGPDFCLPEPPKLFRIVPTARLADAIREQWGGAVEVVSGYRPEAYNRLIGGARRSQHIAFRALDLKPAESFDVEAYFDVVTAVVAGARATGANVGLGLYYDGRGRFAHVDVGSDTGFNRAWTRR